MGSIFGFGGWHSSYFYFFSSISTKLINEEIFIGEDSKLSLDLKIADHKLMILLLGYMSEAFFGFLIYIFLLYLEHKRKKILNSKLSSESIKFKKQTSLDILLQKKSKLENKNSSEIDSNNNSINNSINNSNTLSRSSAFLNDIITTIDGIKTKLSISSNGQNGRKASLIHNDLYQNIGDNSFKYIVLSCCLIISKEYLYLLIYSINDIFDYYFMNLVIITIILKVIYKQKIYKHQLIAVILVIVISSLCFISCLFMSYTSKDNENVYYIDMFDGKYYQIPILIFLYIILSIFFCSGLILQKNLMEFKFISPYKMLLYKGILGIIGSIIGLIIAGYFKCEEELSGDNKEKIVGKTIFEFFVCSNEYNGNFYYDHFISYFTSFEGGRTKEALILILYCIFYFINELSLILINKFLSPTHYLIAESFYSLLHIPVHYLSNASFNEIEKSIDKGEKINIRKIYHAIIQTFKTRILKFIACFFDFLCFIIYLEIIELKFCNLNKNIRKNIEKRALDDKNIVEEDNSSCYSDEEDNIENKDGDILDKEK